METRSYLTPELPVNEDRRVSSEQRAILRGLRILGISAFVIQQIEKAHLLGSLSLNDWRALAVPPLLPNYPDAPMIDRSWGVILRLNAESKLH